MRRSLFPIWEELGVERPAPEQVRRYLVSHGWRERPYGPELFVFERSFEGADEPVVQILPSSQEMPAYPQRLLELLQTLSRLEDRLIRHILADVLAHEANGPPPSAVPGEAAPNGGAAKLDRRSRKNTQT
jgi:hypothetical protein